MIYYNYEQKKDLTAIACVDIDLGIGRNDCLLINIPEDMARFKRLTEGNIVIMGSKTLFSFKHKRPLPNRINIVFTHNTNLAEDYKEYDNIYFVDSIEEMYKIIDFFPNKTPYVIGGGKIYDLLLDYCDKILFTVVEYCFGADTFFPNRYIRNFNIVIIHHANNYNSEKYGRLLYYYVDMKRNN